MPTSHHKQITSILTTIIAINPQSVLDIGTGFGKYGVLCREYLELWDGREDYHHFTRRIDGVEPFTDYLTPIHSFVYNTIYPLSAHDAIKSIKHRYDLVLLIDVLEHIPKNDGRALINAILKKHHGVLISTPKDIGHQDDAFENEFEHHVAQWSMTELHRFGPTLSIDDNESHIVYIGDPAIIETIRLQRVWNRVKQWGSYIPGAKTAYQSLRKKFVKE